MNEKTYGIVLGILNIVLLVVCGILFLGKDKTAPEISLDNVDFVYAAEADEEALFRGVTAVDKEDGELTASVVIEKIVTDTEKKTATITYGVADSAGNVGKVTCTVDMVVPEAEENMEAEEALESGQEAESVRNDIEEEESAEETETEDSEEGEEDTDSEESEEGNEGDSEEEAEDSENENPDEESEEDADSEDAEALPTAGEARNRTQTVVSRQNPGRPTIVFRSQEVKVKVGQSPAWVEVIEGLHDDKDNYETLLKSLKVNGNYDKTKAGAYNVTVTVTDGEGNESNAYPMKIVVEAWE